MKKCIIDNCNRIVSYKTIKNGYAGIEKSAFLGSLIKAATNKNRIDFTGVNNIIFNDNNKIVCVSGYTREKGLFITNII